MNIAGPSVTPNLTPGGLPSPTLDYESAFCQGCRNPIDSDPLHGGVVVQFEYVSNSPCFLVRSVDCNDTKVVSMAYNMVCTTTFYVHAGAHLAMAQTRRSSAFVSQLPMR